MPGWVAAGTALIGTVGSLVKGDAASGAGQTQANAANDAARVQKQMFDQTQTNLSPWMTTGNWANNALATLLGTNPANWGDPSQGVGGTALTQRYQDFSFDPSQVAKDPAYQWQLSEGTRNVLNNSSYLGGVGGNTLRSLSDYGQNTAAAGWQRDMGNQLQIYGANRQNFTGWQQQIYNMLSGQSGAGQNAATNVGNQATQVGGQIGNDLIGAGNALAAGQMGSANAVTGGLGNLGSNAMMYQQMSQNPGYTNPITGVGNWLSGANYNGMMPNTPVGYMPGGDGFMPSAPM